MYNHEDIATLIKFELGSEGVVIKPDAGTHGKLVRLAEGWESILKILYETKPSIINPIGVLAQTYVQKWFYDLRIVVGKERGKAPYCCPTALARAGFKDFRTNTYLGNMVFRVRLPPNIRDTAIKCGEAIAGNSEAWVIAFDAMINVGERKSADDEYVKLELEKLVPAFDAIKRVKRQTDKKKNFRSWNKKLEQAFQNYMSLDAYENVRDVIEESVRSNSGSVLFHEANSCPEFWEQTRLVAGINIAEMLLRCAQSIIGSRTA